ncbi:MAG: hypothetical protein IH840_16630 [Candidatus Heimdallarchaeota archaeon]|nr:hypothetical protein [Candidatus Heimdallarchaeota archaeon]
MASISELATKKGFIELPVSGPTRNHAINKSKIEYVELNANPILGCSHACKYCYARKIDVRFKKVDSVNAWHRPQYFTNFFDLLEAELSKGRVDEIIRFL